MNKSSWAFLLILIFVLGLVIGGLGMSVTLSSNTNIKAHNVEINDFVSIKVYTNSYYDLHKIRLYVADMEDFIYTDGSMLILTKIVQDRFRSVANIRFLKSDGTYYDSGLQWKRHT